MRPLLVSLTVSICVLCTVLRAQLAGSIRSDTKFGNTMPRHETYRDRETNMSSYRCMEQGREAITRNNLRFGTINSLNLRSENSVLCRDASIRQFMSQV